MTKSHVLWLLAGVAVGYLASVYIYTWTGGAIAPLGSSSAGG
jgi:hypothetical protein